MAPCIATLTSQGSNATKPPVKRRVRRHKDEAQRLILDAAETLLRKFGSDAVSVRAVAAKVGLTDAAVNHHFGTRADLLEALLRHGGRRLKAELDAALLKWGETDRSASGLVTVLTNLYADGGYADLALRLHMSGWRDRGSGLLNDAVDVIHRQRINAAKQAGKRSPPLDETRFIVALVHQSLALDPLFGHEFRRSAGVNRASEPSRPQKKRLWTKLLAAMLAVPDTQGAR